MTVPERPARVRDYFDVHPIDDELLPSTPKLTRGERAAELTVLALLMFIVGAAALVVVGLLAWLVIVVWEQVL